jgi:hypothetical protein
VLEHHQAVDGLRREHRQQMEVRLRVTAGVRGVNAERAAKAVLLEERRDRDRALHVMPAQ